MATERFVFAFEKERDTFIHYNRIFFLLERCQVPLLGSAEKQLLNKKSSGCTVSFSLFYCSKQCKYLSFVCKCSAKLFCPFHSKLSFAQKNLIIFKKIQGLGRIISSGQILHFGMTFLLQTKLTFEGTCQPLLDDTKK